MPVDIANTPEVLQPWRWLRQQLATAEDEGYFGPTSTIWRIHQEAVLGLGLARAVFLQLAHPWVAQGVADHSTFQHDPLDRLFATTAAAEFLVFGSRAQADASAARIRAVHARINGVLDEDVGRWRKGMRYSAEDPDALLWVLVTVLDTALVMYERSFGRLQDDVVEAYLADGARVGAMLGVPLEMVPANRASLQTYIHTALADGTVVVGHHAREIATALVRPHLAPVERIVSWPYRSLTYATAVTLLPEPLRSQYGPILRPRRRWMYRLGGRAGRALLNRLPNRWRRDPIAAAAIDRFEEAA